MKNLLLPLCLALSPCLAQETGTDVAEPVVATTGDGQVTEATEEEVDEQWVAEVVEGSENLMKQLTQLLAGISDTATGDAAAEEVADLCYGLISNAVTLTLNEDYAPDAQEFTEAVQKVSAMLKAAALTATHGSGQLELALWGVKHLVALQNQGTDTTAFAYYMDDHAYLIQLAHELNTLIGNIKDKTGADAAVEDAEDIITCIRALHAEENGYGDAQADCDAWLKFTFGATREEAEIVIRKCISDCEALETPYFGSDALKTALLMIDVPYTYDDEDGDEAETAISEEQLQTACDFMDRALGKIPPLKRLLLGVKDKSTADAAAPQIATLRDEIDAVWTDMAVWLESEDVADALGDAVLERYADRLKEADEVDELIAKLGALTPAFYGSEALSDALMSPEEISDTPSSTTTEQ